MPISPTRDASGKAVRRSLVEEMKEASEVGVGSEAMKSSSSGGGVRTVR